MKLSDIIDTEVSEKRVHERVSFREAVQIALKNSIEFRGSVGQDISEGGIRLNVSKFLALNDEVELQIHLSKDQMIECAGSVKWIEKFPHNDRYHVGVEFSKIDSLSLSRKAINQLITSNK